MESAGARRASNAVGVQAREKTATISAVERSSANTLTH
jgi:hypothetical protein